MAGYGFIAAASAVYLVWRHPLADVAARAAAPIGALYTAICLITGSIWRWPTWRPWWEWDGRLTSMLVPLFLHQGDTALAGAGADRDRGSTTADMRERAGARRVPHTP